MKAIPYVLTVALAVTAPAVAVRQIRAMMGGAAVDISCVQPLMAAACILAPDRFVREALGALGNYAQTVAIYTSRLMLAEVNLSGDGTTETGTVPYKNDDMIGTTAIRYSIAIGGNFLSYVWGGPNAEARAISIAGWLVRVVTDTVLNRTTCFQTSTTGQTRSGWFSATSQ
jgi:hypothetical protein